MENKRIFFPFEYKKFRLIVSFIYSLFDITHKENKIQEKQIKQSKRTLSIIKPRRRHYLFHHSKNKILFLTKSQTYRNQMFFKFKEKEEKNIRKQ